MKEPPKELYSMRGASFLLQYTALTSWFQSVKYTLHTFDADKTAIQHHTDQNLYGPNSGLNCLPSPHSSQVGHIWALLVKFKAGQNLVTAGWLRWTVCLFDRHP